MGLDWSASEQLDSEADVAAVPAADPSRHSDCPLAGNPISLAQPEMAESSVTAFE
ncbi:hypothetical protein FHR71_005500 [Methylobacterium sp. RAS18]|nr:hypothetical protein [Methylobacterium sp. RAS18]